MKKKFLKTNKGITLIALIITIIVLVILAVVAINAVNDGGIIQHAQNAKTEHELAQEKEGVYLATNQAFLTGKGKIAENNLTDALNSQFGAKDTKWKYTETTAENFKIQILDSKREYIIYTNAKVEGPLGEINGGSITPPEDEITDDIIIGETTYTTAEVLEKLGIEESEYMGTYDGTWTVIGVEGEKIKLMSSTYISEGFYLGDADKGAEAAGLTDIQEKAIWSWNHLVETYNQEVETATKGMLGARSITLEDIEKILNITEEKKKEYSEKYGRTYKFTELQTNKVSYQFLEWNEIDTEEEDSVLEGWSEPEEYTGMYWTKIKYVGDFIGNEEKKWIHNVYELPNAFAGTKLENFFKKQSTTIYLANKCVAMEDGRIDFIMPYIKKRKH